MVPLVLAALAFADEGMYLPEQLPVVGPGWVSRGLEVPPASLADPLQKPLSAIVSLGFCSASFVSAEGLIFTNHHCVEGYLQQNSSAEANRHRDGYFAASRGEELSAGPAARIWVVEKIEDVTAQVLAKAGPKVKDAAREAAIDAARKRLIAACEAAPNRRCRVATYFGGAQYRLITQLEIKDVRIVAAPPMALGQFGGEVDNWMWPRHGTDFAVLRAYVAPDGSSAPYSKDNVPYRPSSWLTIDPTGAEPDSFVMVAGYPGGTSRHGRAASFQWYTQDYLPQQMDLTREAIRILQDFADKDPDAAARVGSSISGLANGLKNSEGLLAGLSAGDLLAARQAQEVELLRWVDADPARRGKWRAHLDEQVALQSVNQKEASQLLVVGWLLGSADLLGVANTAVRFATEGKKPDLARDAGYQDRDRERTSARFEAMDTSLHLPSDRALFTAMLARYQAQPPERRVAEIDAWIAAKGGPEKAVELLYRDPALAKKDARLALLGQRLEDLRASRDPWVELAVVIEAWAAPRRAQQKVREGAMLRVSPSWYAALDAWTTSKGRVLYPDANGTLRITLGHVRGYSPRDGLIAAPQTTLGGMVPKVGAEPFDLPAFWTDKARQGSGSRWKDPKLGDVPMNFLSTLDITGGNSGSAVLDGQGRLVGLAFDGNYESIASDWVFLPEVTRCIGVDVRAMAWVLENGPNSSWILGELGLAP